MAHKEPGSARTRGAPQRGVDILADAVKAGARPKGRYVVLDKKFGALHDHERRRHHRP